MPIVKCPECGKKISDKAASCPNCGFPMSAFNGQIIESSTDETQFKKEEDSSQVISNINLDTETKSNDLEEVSQSILGSNKTKCSNLTFFTEKPIDSGETFIEQSSNQLKQIEHKRLFKLIKIFSITFLAVFLTTFPIIKLVSSITQSSEEEKNIDTIVASNTSPNVSETPIQISDIPSITPIMATLSPEPEDESYSIYVSLDEFNAANSSEHIATEEINGIWASEKDSDGIEYSIVLTESGFLFYEFTNSEKTGETYGLYEYVTENNSNVLILHQISGGITEYQIVKANNKFAMKTSDTEIILTKIQSENVTAGGETTVTQKPEQTSIPQELEAKPQLSDADSGYDSSVTQQPEQTSIPQELEAKPQFSDAIAVGFRHVVALRKDRTVVAVGDNEYGQCDVSDWTDIIAVSADDNRTIGLRKDGTVVAVGDNEYGQCGVSEWTDIIAVSAGNYHTIGLRKDGTVVAVGDNEYGQCDISDWTDIIAVSAGDTQTIGLKKDGTVVSAGQCDVSDWTDIIAVSAGDYHTIGLRKDGTVVAFGNNLYGQCDVSDWTDIIAVSADDNQTIALRKDGTVVAVGSNKYGQCDVSDWTDIIAVSAGDYQTIGLRKDGTVVAVGDDYNGDCNVSDWTGIIATSGGNLK